MTSSFFKMGVRFFVLFCFVCKPNRNAVSTCVQILQGENDDGCSNSKGCQTLPDGQASSVMAWGFQLQTTTNHKAAKELACLVTNSGLRMNGCTMSFHPQVITV